MYQKQPKNKKYCMTRVIYGVSSNSYYAIRALLDTAKDAPSIHCKNSLFFMLTTFLVAMTHQSKSLACSKTLQLLYNSLGCLVESGQATHMSLWKPFLRKIFSSVNITTPSKPMVSTGSPKEALSTSMDPKVRATSLI